MSSQLSGDEMAFLGATPEDGYLPNLQVFGHSDWSCNNCAGDCKMTALTRHPDREAGGGHIYRLGVCYHCFVHGLECSEEGNYLCQTEPAKRELEEVLSLESIRKLIESMDTNQPGPGAPKVQLQRFEAQATITAKGLDQWRYRSEVALVSDSVFQAVEEREAHAKRLSDQLSRYEDDYEEMRHQLEAFAMEVKRADELSDTIQFRKRQRKRRAQYKQQQQGFRKTFERMHRGRRQLFELEEQDRENTFNRGQQERLKEFAREIFPPRKASSSSDSDSESTLGSEASGSGNE